MKKFYSHFFFLLGLLTYSLVSNSQTTITLAEYQANNNPVSGPSGSAATGNVIATGINRGPGISYANGSTYSAQSWTTDFSNRDPNDYFEISIAPEAGYSITLTHFELCTQRSIGGPQCIRIFSSVDNFTNSFLTDCAIETNPGTTEGVSLTSYSGYSNVTSNIRFRIYGYRASLSSETLSFNSISGYTKKLLPSGATVGIYISGSVSKLPTATISGTTSVCQNSTSPKITFTGANGTPPYTFTYNVNNGTSQTITTTSGSSVSISVPTTVPGVYSYNLVNVSDNTGKSQTQSGSAVVTVNAKPTINITADSIACNGGSTTVTISASGGQPPYSDTGNFAVGAGTYTYTVTDTKGCSDSRTITISQPPKLVGSSSFGKILCKGGSVPVTISATGGTPPYSGTGTFVRNAGPFSYTITDAKGCSVIVSGNISEPELLLATASATSILCNGGTAVITVSATGGTPPYSGTGTFAVYAGSYSYVVSDSNGCTSTSTITVQEPQSLQASASAETITCKGGTTNVTVNAIGGTTPYTGTGTFAKPAGNYTFLVTDANGCQALSNSIALSDGTKKAPSRPSVINGETYNVCNGNYSYSISPVTGAISYSWSVPAGTNIITNNGTSILLNVSVGFISGTISVTANNECGPSTARTKNIFGRPNTPVISGPTCVAAFQNGITYSVSNPDANATFQWRVPTGVTIVSGQSTSSIIVNWNNVSGKLSVTSSNNCASSLRSSLNVTVGCSAATTSIKSITKIDNFVSGSKFITINPNPNNGRFTITVNNNNKKVTGSILIYNSYGQKIYQQEIKDKYANRLDIELKDNIPNGIYKLLFKDDTGLIYASAFLINR